MTHLKGLGFLIATCLQALLHSWVTEQYIYISILYQARLKWFAKHKAVLTDKINMEGGDPLLSRQLFN